MTKTEHRQAVAEESIQFEILNESHFATISNYMNAHFDTQHGDYAFERVHFSIPKDQSSHVKSSTVVNTMPGTSKYQCLSIKITNMCGIERYFVIAVHVLMSYAHNVSRHQFTVQVYHIRGER